MYAAFVAYNLDRGMKGWVGIGALLFVRIERLSRRLDAASRLLDRYSSELARLSRQA